MSNKRKNTIMLLVGLVLIIYSCLIVFLPMSYTKHLNDKTVIRPFEDLLNLRFDYSAKSKVVVKPNFEVNVYLYDFDVNKPGLDMHIGSVGNVKIVMPLSSYMSKNYNLKSISLKNVIYDRVTIDGVSEITTYLKKYTKLPEQGKNYAIKPCDIKIDNMKVTLFEHPQEQYSEKNYNEYSISASDFATYITNASNGAVKVLK